MDRNPGPPETGAPDPRWDRLIEPEEIRSALVDLARPRLAGTAGAAATERELRRRFRELGYRVRPLELSFSTLPGRFGLPAAGAALLATAPAAGWLLHLDRAAPALAVLVGGLGLALLPLLLLDAGLRRLPWGRIHSANLLFTRDAPRWLAMAHRDTKSQAVPTLVRTVALAGAATAWAGLAAVATLRMGPGVAPGAVAASVPALAAVLTAAAAVLLLCRARNRSPGALDNGTGLAALLA
ncbi:MAG: hypothetical protein ACOCUW_01885, partial [Gemmatimonadota bacterium]